MAYVVEGKKLWRCRDHGALAHPVSGLYAPGTYEPKRLVQGQVGQLFSYTAGALLGTPDGAYGQVPTELNAWVHYTYALQDVQLYLVKVSGAVVSYPVTAPPHGSSFTMELLTKAIPTADQVPVMYAGISLEAKPDSGAASTLGFGGLAVKSGTTVLDELELSGDEEATIASQARAILAGDAALLSMLNGSQYATGNQVRVYQQIVPESLGLPAVVVSPIDARDTPLLNQERLMVRGMVDVKVISEQSYQQAADIYNRADRVLTRNSVQLGLPDYEVGKFHRVKTFRYPEQLGKGHRFHLGGTYRCYAQQL